MEELCRNLKTISTALNDLSIQLKGLELSQEASPSVLPRNASDNKHEQRTSGYVNWNSTHDILKTENWMKMSKFTEYCGRLQIGVMPSFNSWINMEDKYVVNEETRFPKDDLYVNVSNPLVSAEILSIKELGNPEVGLVDRFLNKAKSEMHTLSSFEMKYGLKWVEPSTVAGDVVKVEAVHESVSRPNNDTILESGIPDPWCLSEDPKLEEVESFNEEDLVTEELRKQFTAILDQLTPRNFDNLLDNVMKLEINNEKKIEVVAELLFEKALEKPDSSEVYATLAKRLSKLKVPSDNNPDQHISFRGLIICKCQNLFETNKSDAQVKLLNEFFETNPNVKKELQVKFDEQNKITRFRAVANAKFIGELYKLKLVTAKIIDYCLRCLSNELEEDKLECLCELITTVGKQFEKEAISNLDNFFMKMQEFVNLKHSKISRRVQFMVQDVVDLRNRRWAMNITPVVKALPKTMHEIQEESEKRALLIELMKAFDVGRSGDDGAGNVGGDGISHKEEGWGKHGNRNSYSIDKLKLEAKTEAIQNYIQRTPESFTKISDSVLAKLQADPTSRGDILIDQNVAPTYQTNGASTERSTFNSTEDFAPVVAQMPITSKIKSDVKSTVELFLINPDERELVNDVKIVYPLKYHAAVVEEMLNVALDKNMKEIEIIARALLHLVTTNTIAAEIFVAGLNETFMHAPDLLIDIPMLYVYLGKILAPHIKKNHITIAKIFELSEFIISEYQGDRLLASIIDCLTEDGDHELAMIKWQESGLQLSQWMREEQVPEFIYDNDFEFLNFTSNL